MCVEATAVYIIIYVCMIEDMVRTGVVPSSSKSRILRVIATDGTGDGLTGICIFFLRPHNTKPITTANIAEELHCGQLDARGGRSLLQVMKEYMQLIMLPALMQGQKWQNLPQKQVDTFMSTINGYINFLQSMKQVIIIMDGYVNEYIYIRFATEYRRSGLSQPGYFY